MKPSQGLEAHREAIRRIVAAHRGLNPRVFGSVRRGEDREGSDLDLLVDAGKGMTLFDLAEIEAAVELLIRVRVDARTPEDFPVINSTFIDSGIFTMTQRF